MKMKKSRGFLLAEAIFSVFITAIIVLILQNLLQNLHSAEKLGHKTDEVAFAYVQLDRFLHDDAISYSAPDKSHAEKAVFTRVTNKGEKSSYALEVYIKNDKKMLRTTTTVGGHMPLLVDLRKVDLKTNKEWIKINLTEKDGRKSQLIFKMDDKPKKNEIKNKENKG